MKKDITNVVITFGLIGLMLTGSAFFYTKKILAEEAAFDAVSVNEDDSLGEQSKIQEQMLADQADEAQLLAEKDRPISEEGDPEEVLIETSPSKPVVTKPKTTTTFASEIAKKQAEYQATQQAILEAQQAELKKKQTQADLLAQQLADQKAAEARAQQLADQKAAQRAASQRASRRSRAS